MSSLKDRVSSWNELGIRDTHLMQAEYNSHNGNEYWTSVVKFLKKIKTMEHSDLTIREIKWAKKIRDEVF